MTPKVGLSRYAQYLPTVGEWVTLGEGATPLLPLDVLAKRLGIGAVSAKLELLNPTGSYKDRVAAMSLSVAKARGCHGWIATSSGNAGMAFAAYGARAGLPGFLAVVSTAPREKRASMVPFGAGLTAVEGIGDAGSRLTAQALFDGVVAAAERHGLYLGVTAYRYNPDGMRGVETISYELAEQVPDATCVYVPVGGGGLLVSVARGLARTLVSAGLVACQSSGCAPVVRYLSGELPQVAIELCESEVSALQLPNPPDGPAAADAVVASGGWGVSVEDEDVFEAQRMLAEAEGVLVEPAAAVTVAALIHDVKRGRVDEADHPVLILTGAGWKDLRRFDKRVEGISVVATDGLGSAIDKWAAANVAH